ncbi:MAG: hypothetical protein RR623_08280 [Bacilli bacterium]
MKPRYYNYYPRNFNNEYTTIKIENEEELELLTGLYEDLKNGSIDRVTLKCLRKLSAIEKDRKKYEESSSGYCNPSNPVPFNEFAFEHFKYYFEDYLMIKDD